jgi:signal transduction histidine kinase
VGEIWTNLAYDPNKIKFHFRKLKLIHYFESSNVHMLRLFAVVVLFSLKALPVFSQHHTIDSLSRVLENTKDKKQQVDILNSLAEEVYDYSTATGFDYASRAYELADKLNDQKGKRRSLTLQGYYFYTNGNYGRALSYYRQSSNVPLPADDLLGYNLVMMGNVFRVTGAYDSAEYYYQNAIDNLSQIGAKTEMAFAYKSLGRLYLLQWKNDAADSVFANALQIYQKSGNKFGLADIWFLVADLNKNRSEYDDALSAARKGCQIANATDDEFLKLQCLIVSGNIHNRKGEYTQALTNYFEALGILKSKDMPLMLCILYSDIGDVYRALIDHDVAWKYYLEALRIAEKLGIKHQTGKLYSNMAWLYRDQNDFIRAHDFIDRSLAIRQEIGDNYGISHAYNVLGLIYYREKKYARAEEAFNQSLEIRKQIRDREGISSCLYNLSLVYASQNQLAKSLQLQVEALKIEEAVGNKFYTGYSHNRLGELYTRLKQYPKAIAHLQRAEKLANDIGSSSLQMNIYQNWSRYFEAKNNPALALRYYKKYSAAHDSIYNEIGAQKLAELQALYLMEKKDQEIEMLNQDKLISQNQIQLQRSRINLQNIIIISGITGFVMVSLLAFTIYRYNRRIKKAHREISDQKEEIQSQSEELIDANETIAEINKKLEGKIEERTVALSQAYKELDTFFYRSSHDFRRPLTTFMGLAEVAKVTVKDANALELFEKVKETAYNLDKMLVKLQSISDMGSQQLVYKEVMIKEIFETVCDTFRDELHRKNIKTSAEIRLPGPFISYPAMIKIIIENLVENAIHFCGMDNPFIKLKTTQSGEYITIDMQDNGQGISREYQDQVFDMYFRANERSKGNGLGLYIVKKAVEKLDGSISLSSIHLVGTTFTIMLPVGQKQRR